MNVLHMDVFENEIKLAKRYLEQVDSSIALTINKNLMENVKFPKINRTQTWKSSVLPTRATKTTRGMLYRSQLSNVSKATINLPTLPQISYQQICQQKAVHAGEEESQRLVIERITIPPYEPSIQLNRRAVIPPIRRKRESVGHQNTPHDTNAGNGSIQVHMKWNDSCKCTRCKLMKSDYEVGSKDLYSHWGQYPCIPDAIINRDDQDSSDDER